MSAAPWSVKGIDPKAREVAKDLARRSGMTLGEWLNTMIMEDAEDEEIVVPLSRRAHAADVFERRGRSRRLDDVYGGSDDTLQRVAASVEAIAARLEAAERRSTLAIQGVDQAVNGLVRRLDGQEAVGRTYGRRIDDIAEELREGHRRLRAFEQETGPKTAETFGKVETGLGALASRLYDIEERQRTSFNELRQRMEAAEKTAQPGPGADLMAQASARLDQAQAQTTAALRGLERSFAGLDQRLRAAESRVEPEGAREAARFEKLAETLSRQVETNRAEMMRRLDTAEQDNRLARIEAAVAAAAEQVKAAEQRSAHGIESMGREVLRIAQNLNGRVQATDLRAQSVEGRLQALDGRINGVETAAIEKMAAIGEALASDLNRSLGEKMDREMARHAQVVDHRLTRAEDQQALGLERLGAEITRISDRLSDRIAQSERKSAQALDDVARRLGDSSDRVEQAYGRVSGEMAERLRLSEERTAALIAEARETMGRRAEKAAETPAAASPVEDLRRPDWRSAAFPEETFDDALWAAPSHEAGAPAPFPAFETLDDQAADDDYASAGRAVAEATPVDRLIADMTADWDAPAEPLDTGPVFGSPSDPLPTPASEPFGGADVTEALAATTPSAFTAQVPAFAGSAEAPLIPFETADPLAADDDFVDVQALRAGLSAGVPAGRAEATRGAIDA
ncbi:MAG: SEL1-like repeat protein, partial [Brevundimonas sp.]